MHKDFLTFHILVVRYCLYCILYTFCERRLRLKNWNIAHRAKLNSINLIIYQTHSSVLVLKRQTCYDLYNKFLLNVGR